MKRLQSTRMLIKFGDKGEWETYWHTRIRYEEEEQTEEFSFSFQKYFEIINENPNTDATLNSSTYRTMFRHRPIIIFKDFFNKTYNEKQAPTIYFKRKIYTHEHNSIQDLMEDLPSNEFLEYLKDNGIHFCPMKQE